MMGVETTVCVVLLCGLFVWTLADTHSLSYLYTVQSKSSPERGSGFSVVTLLDDEQIDSYSSNSTVTDGIRIPKQDWLRKMKESEWKASTDKLKSDGLWLNYCLNIQMKVFGHDKSDGHTLQWMIGCDVNKNPDGSVSVINCINEYAYDGEDFISYNWTLKKWTASVSQAKEMEDEWNSGQGQHANQKLEECVSWLKTYLQYSTTETNQTPPDVHMFVKKYKANSNKLTCLATGFYPTDVVVSLRKFGMTMPEHLLTSSGVRPNEDGTYQLRKSVEILKGEKADYDCYVNHSSLNRPKITKWEHSVSQRVLAWALVSVSVSSLVLLVLNEVYIHYRSKAEPRNLRVVETTRTSVEVQWEKPLGEIDRYILSVQPSQTDGPVLSRQIKMSPGEDSAVIDDLEPGSEYIISLVAVRGWIRSRPVTVEADTRSHPDTADGPDADDSDADTWSFRPRKLRVVETTPTSVKIRWKKPLEEIDRYILSVSPCQADGSDNRRQIKVSSGERSAVIDYLEPGSVYIICLVAEKDGERSAPMTAEAATSFRGSGSPHDSVENVDETAPMIQRTTKVADNPPEETRQRLWSSAAALLQDR